MTVELTRQQLDFVKQELVLFREEFGRTVLSKVQEVLRYRSPLPTIQAILQGMHDLEANLSAPSAKGTVWVLGDEIAPMLKLVILARRRVVAADVEDRKAKTTSPEVIATLEVELSQFDSILDLAWAKTTVAVRKPRLADFLTLEEVEKALGTRLPSRQYDEKFHLL